jgi:hemerythrin superfamily protein
MAHELFTRLHQEHQKVEELLNRFETPGGAAGERSQLYETLKMALLPHMKAEEASFYQRLMELPETNDDGVDGVEQHYEIEKNLKELEAMPKDSPVWLSRLQETAGLIKRHVKTEETKVFADTERILSQSEIDEVSRKFQQTAAQHQKLMAAGIAG